MSKRENIGIDGMNFEYSLEEQLYYLSNGKTLFMEKQEIINRDGYAYGTIESKRDKINIYLNLSKYLYGNNIKPFTKFDTAKLKEINEDLKDKLRHILMYQGLGEINTDYLTEEILLKSNLKRIECNNTRTLKYRCTCNDVINILHRSYTETKNSTVQVVSEECIYEKINQSLLIPIKHHYDIKCYNKGIKEGLNEELLRIEIAMKYRVIEKLFGRGNPINIVAILNKESI